MAAPGVVVSAGLWAAALVVALAGGLGSGSVVGALLAFAGAIVAGWGVWKGMQRETQTGAVLSILLLLANVGLAGLLVILKVLHALR